MGPVASDRGARSESTRLPLVQPRAGIQGSTGLRGDPLDDYRAIYEATGELSRLLLEETRLETTLLGIGNLAASVIPSCEEAGVTLETSGHVSVRVSTGDVAERVDAYQYEIDEGPCVAAADTKGRCLSPT